MLVRSGEERDLANLVSDARHASRRRPLCPSPRAVAARLRAEQEAAARRAGPAGAPAGGVLRRRGRRVGRRLRGPVRNANGWTLEEAGDRDPAGARLGAMLQVLVAREPAQSARR